MTAIERFHALHSAHALAVNVTRYPYSFSGADRSGNSQLSGVSVADGGGELETWHESLLGYMGNDPQRREQAEQGMLWQGRQAGIEFDYNVQAQWQPVESQRMLLWAGRFGKAEPWMTALNKMHFTQKISASKRSTLLAAAAQVNLSDAATINAFLDSDELEEDVWAWYGRTIEEKGIHSIPLFAFSVPAIGAVGGPFRAKQKDNPFIVRGSMDAEYFLELFEGRQRLHRRGRGRRERRAGLAHVA